MQRIISLVFSFFPALLLALSVAAQSVPPSFKSAKNASSDLVYGDNPTTLYCGCGYTSHNDSDGSGKVSLSACEMEPLSKKQNTATVIQWEHIVPASLMPARSFACWENPKQFPKCVSKSGNVKSGRNCCESISDPAKQMLFDLHNLAPAIGQVNQYRTNDRYGDVKGAHESWPGCEVKDTGGVSSNKDGIFEPADCTKGDVARIWFYMHDTHGVVIPDDEWNMFVDWDASDPISPWELERDSRIAQVQGNSNPYVQGFEEDASGACRWEPKDF